MTLDESIHVIFDETNQCRSGFYKELCRRRWAKHHFVNVGILSRKTTDWFCETTGWNSTIG